jgi:hypothetical protein
VQRSDFGLPANWSRVQDWLSFNGPVVIPFEKPAAVPELKWSDIPILNDYRVIPDESFWKDFPKRDLPSTAETKINVENLEEKVNSLSGKLYSSQFERARRALNYLRFGAPAFQKKRLSACYVNNSSVTYKYGAVVTDNIATWIKKGFASGPFDAPPCTDFRVNPLLAVVQPDKVRPVLNVSMPKGNSYNSNVDEFELEKVKMSSAMQFGHALLKCGKNATMSKFDLVAAYKQVPCKVEDIRLQGFMWCGKFFAETRLVFGASNSVCNYDIIGDTLKVLALAESEIPAELVLRQIDDVPVVSPENSNWCEDFSAKYKQLCEFANVELAENCPLNEKAFENQKRGKVLGILFDSTDLTWAIPPSKVRKTVASIKIALENDDVSLVDMQKLMGRLNHIAQMCTFMKIFTPPLNESFKNVPTNAEPSTKLKVSPQGRADLMVWAGFLLNQFKWLPLPKEQSAAPVYRKELYTDAAGLPDLGQIWKKPGCGGVGFSETGEISLAFQYTWPEEFVVSATDENGTRFGDKTTTLEALGLLFAILQFPEFFKNQHVVVKIDNLGVVWGMLNQKAKEDTAASVLIRSVSLVCAYLECVLHVEHQPRMSDWGSELADRLSRQCSTTRHDRSLVQNWSRIHRIPPCLSDWLANPRLDWNLAKEILKFVTDHC